MSIAEAPARPVAPEESPGATLADLIAALGNVPLERIPARPAPGTAAETDVLARPDGEKRLYELADGVLIEKTMGAYESILAGILIQLLRNFLDENPLGTILGADGPVRLSPGLVRMPDVGFVGWERFPGGELPDDAILNVTPDLAVEVLSRGNTPEEMERKLREYFAAGCRLVWYVDPRTRSAKVYTSPDTGTELNENGVLDGGDVLPGFRLTLRDWLARAERRPTA